MTPPKPKLRWFQYSLRTLLVVVTLFAVPCSWLAVKRQQARREREAAAAFQTLGGEVKWSQPSGPEWLRKQIGDDLFTHVDFLGLGGTEVTDEGLERLKWLSQLQGLNLGQTDVTDAGLEHLKGLSQLRVLGLLGCRNITDAGLESLKGLSQLQTLGLRETNITDAGLEHLKGLSQLQYLNLSFTSVTDTGLENLKRLSQLRELSLRSTRVTPESVKKLEAALPKCKVFH